MRKGGGGGDQGISRVQLTVPELPGFESIPLLKFEGESREIKRCGAKSV